MISSRKTLLVAAMAMLAVGGTGTTVSAQDYPSRELRLLLGFPPGGGVDVQGRLIAEYLSRALGQRVVVENRGGANAVAATREVVRSNPDGYTLLFGATNMAVNLVGLKEPGYKWDDLAVIGGATYSPLVVLVSTASSKARSLKEMIAFGKANPGKLTFATNGPQSVNNLMARRLDQASGIAWREVPYKGSAQIMQDMIAGNVDAFFGLPSSGLAVKDRPDMAVFGVTDTKRMSAMPDVPTFEEQGFPMIDDITVGGLWVRAGTPKPVIDKLRAALEETKKNPEFRERIEKTGNLAYEGTPEQFDKRLRDMAELYDAEFKKLGIEPQ